METKEFFRTEYMSWDDVSHLGDVERVAIILDEGRTLPSKYDNNKNDLLLTVQMGVNHEIFVFRVNKKTWRNLKEVWGTKSEEWRGKKVLVMPFTYGQKIGIELVPLRNDEVILSPSSFSEGISKSLSEEQIKELDGYIEKVKKAFVENIRDEK